MERKKYFSLELYQQIQSLLVLFFPWCLSFHTTFTNFKIVCTQYESESVS